MCLTMKHILLLFSAIVVGHKLHHKEIVRNFAFRKNKQRKLDTLNNTKREWTFFTLSHKC